MASRAAARSGSAASNSRATAARAEARGRGWARRAERDRPRWPRASSRSPRRPGRPAGGQQKTSVMCRFSAGTSRTSSVPPSASSTHVASALAASAASVYAMKMRGRLTLASGSLLAAQVLVHEGDRHAALADRRGDALDRAEAHVAAGEDAGHARLQQVGIAVVRPAPALGDVGAGQHVAARVARDLRRQPAGVGVGADEDEQAAALVPRSPSRWRGRGCRSPQVRVAVDARRPPRRAGRRCSTCPRSGRSGSATCSSPARRRGTTSVTLRAWLAKYSAAWPAELPAPMR